MDPNTLRLMQGSAGAGAKLYVEDVFSTWLYTGTGSTQTITNGIDLSGKGGMVWMKSRTSPTQDWEHCVVDTARGVRNTLVTNANYAAFTAIAGTGLTAFNSSGFTLGSNSNGENPSTAAVASWTFRKQAKFFDVVTYTGNGSNRTIAHSLGSVPGCIIVKRTDTTSDWRVYHRSLPGGALYDLKLNTNGGIDGGSWDNTNPTNSVFSLGTAADVNANGGTYVAYLFAHDAGGFGDSGNESVIKCGTYVGQQGGTYPIIDLGWEPQWLLIKKVGTDNWNLVDNMRGFTVGGNEAELNPNLSAAESVGEYVTPLPTGFQLATTNSDYNGAGGFDYIYIAIRRGPMKTPTDATKVFYADTGTNSTGATVTTSFPVDLMIQQYRDVATNHFVYDRLRSLSSTTTEDGLALFTSATAAESVDANQRNWSNTGYQVPSAFSASSRIFWNFRRAPGFFDMVAYTGTGSATTVSHNLGVVPELMIVKPRSAAGAWVVGANFGSSAFDLYTLNSDGAASTAVSYSTAQRFSAQPSSTVFSIGASASTNASGTTYVAYLFGSVSGVSKVGSYTGTGTTLSIDCGFTAGARFVLIKRTDSTGDWYVWDSARGIVSGDDPYLLLNNTNAEVTGTDYVDPYSPGFQISSTAPAAINANGGSFIFLAVA